MQESLQTRPGRVRRDTGALSTSASQAELAPTWKQEVNQRLAAHLSRKNGTTTLPDRTGVAKRLSSNLAAAAAARVAARYAKAPSYSEMLAGEARAAVRAAEAASRAALEAQAAAEFVLAGLEAGAEEQSWEPEKGERSLENVDQAWEPKAELPEPLRPVPIKASTKPSSERMKQESYGIRWEADLPVRETVPALVHATHGPGAFENPEKDWWQRSIRSRDAEDGIWGTGAVEVVEPAQPLHANLIQFPRELVATRKVRPRLIDGPNASAGDAVGQLSIFEVVPGSISTEPLAPEMAVETAWPVVDWSSIQLDEHPSVDWDLGSDPAPADVVLHPASISLRIMATVVDCSLITGVLVAGAIWVLERMQQMPALKGMEIGAAVAWAGIFVAYQVLFFALGEATPGMKWAHISVRTLGDARPTRGQRCGRLVALVLSLLPVGLGVAWAIFDEDHLTWHDRLSETYLRKAY
jgi:uncharacterized RDD family membrane protein YckC